MKYKFRIQRVVISEPSHKMYYIPEYKTTFGWKNVVHHDDMGRWRNGWIFKEHFETKEEAQNQIKWLIGNIRIAKSHANKNKMTVEETTIII